MRPGTFAHRRIINSTGFSFGCPLQGAAFAMPSRGSRQVVLAFSVARSFGAELGPAARHRSPSRRMEFARRCNATSFLHLLVLLGADGRIGRLVRHEVAEAVSAIGAEHLLNVRIHVERRPRREANLAPLPAPEGEARRARTQRRVEPLGSFHWLHAHFNNSVELEAVRDAARVPTHPPAAIRPFHCPAANREQIALKLHHVIPA